MIERVIRAIKLDATLYQEVDADDSMTKEAGVLVLGIGLIAGLLSLFSGDTGLFTWIFFGIFVMPIVFAFSVGIWFIVGKLFGGEGSLMGVGRALAFAATPWVVLAIPVVGLIAFPWVMITSIVAVRESHKISTGAAAATVLLPSVIGFILSVIVFATIFAALFSAIS